ncbi:MAG: hypothetical protein MJE77_28815 [Proteobacteria bacterium]|nr:hypothetical protein [Pseudomonadota bacterium]
MLEFFVFCDLNRAAPPSLCLGALATQLTRITDFRLEPRRFANLDRLSLSGWTRDGFVANIEFELCFSEQFIVIPS